MPHFTAVPAEELARRARLQRRIEAFVHALERLERRADGVRERMHAAFSTPLEDSNMADPQSDDPLAAARRELGRAGRQLETLQSKLDEARSELEQLGERLQELAGAGPGGAPEDA